MASTSIDSRRTEEQHTHFPERRSRRRRWGNCLMEQLDVDPLFGSFALFSPIWYSWSANCEQRKNQRDVGISWELGKRGTVGEWCETCGNNMNLSEFSERTHRQQISRSGALGPKIGVLQRDLQLDSFSSLSLENGKYKSFLFSTH